MSKARGGECRRREGALGGRCARGSKRNGKCAKGRGDVGAGGGECEDECHVEASAPVARAASHRAGRLHFNPFYEL